MAAILSRPQCVKTGSPIGNRCPAFHNDYTSEEEYLGKLDFVRFMFKTILDRF